MTDTDVKVVLEDALNLISDPDKWTRQVFARDAEGFVTNAGDPEAVCWCAFGALVKTARTYNIDVFIRASDLVQATAKKQFKTNAIEVNDKLGYEAAKELLQAAVDAA
jgi:hypothetical protein